MAARRGDDKAREQLYRRYVHLVANTAYRLLGHDHELEDLVQETFAYAFEHLADLDNPKAFSGWIRRIAVGTTIATIRRRRLLTRLGLVRPVTIEVDEVIARTAPSDVLVMLERVYQLVGSLPPKERVVLVLRRVEECTLNEIVELTGWSLSTVKRRLKSAERRLLQRRGEEL